MQHMTGSAKWQKQARLVIISRKKLEKNRSISLWNTPSSLSLDRVLTSEIVRAGMDKQKVSLMARLHEPLRNRSHLLLQLFPYPSQRKQKHLTVCHKPQNPEFIQSVEVIPTSVIRSFLSNAKAGPFLRLYQFCPGAMQPELTPEEKCYFLKLWVIWSYVWMTLTQTQTFGFVRLHVT